MTKIDAMKKLGEALIAARDAGILNVRGQVMAVDAVVGKVRIILIPAEGQTKVIPGQKDATKRYKRTDWAYCSGWAPFSDQPEAKLELKLSHFHGEIDAAGQAVSRTIDLGL